MVEAKRSIRSYARGNGVLDRFYRNQDESWTLAMRFMHLKEMKWYDMKEEGHQVDIMLAPTRALYIHVVNQT
jgi:hypothetical protein